MKNGVLIVTVAKCQILLGNFKNIKSKQRKQRVRKQATEKFSVAIFCIFYVGLFFSSREYNHLCKYYPKKNFTFS